MPLDELATASRTAGANAVLRKLKSGSVKKVFLSKEADRSVLEEVIRAAQEKQVPIEWAEESLQLGRACAVSRRTAAAALLKE